MATPQDPFEFDAAKYSNFGELNETANVSTFFKEVNLKTPMRDPLPNTLNERDTRDCGPIDFDVLAEDKENAPSSSFDIHEEVKSATQRLSQLAFFNPAASRHAEKVKRRSKQIVNEPTPAQRRSIQPPKTTAKAPLRRSVSKTREVAPPPSQGRLSAAQPSGVYLSTRARAAQRKAETPAEVQPPKPAARVSLIERTRLSTVTKPQTVAPATRRSASKPREIPPTAPVVSQVAAARQSFKARPAPNFSARRPSVTRVPAPSSQAPPTPGRQSTAGLSDRLRAAAERLSVPRQRKPSIGPVAKLPQPPVTKPASTKTLPTPALVRRASTVKTAPRNPPPPISARAQAAAERLSAPKKR